LHKGGEGREEGREVADVLVVVVETLDGVPHQGVVGDRGVDVGEGVGGRFLLKAVGGDALVPLLDVAELLAEVARVRLLVVAEEGGDPPRMAKAVLPVAMTMLAMSGVMEPYNQRRTVESIR
jgi:hypothetical protein